MSVLFNGLSAFPITPFKSGDVDQNAFVHLISRLVEAKVDSIGIGSTASYAFLSREERRKVIRLAVENASNIPVIASIGSINQRDVLDLAKDAEQEGASALLLPPMSYFPLRENEVFGLYEAVSEAISLPIVIYDTPGTTQFTFSDELIGEIAKLPHVRSIKVPSSFPTPQKALERLKNLEAKMPESLVIGVSGDPTAASSLMVGAKIWYSEWGGLFPQWARKLTDAALAGDQTEVDRVSALFKPFWEMSTTYGGSLRVLASVAEIMGLTLHHSLALPLQRVSQKDYEMLVKVVSEYHPA